MVYITGETIKSAVSLKIRNTFKTTEEPVIYPTIYKEQILQGFKKPCFFITHIDVSQIKLRRDLYRRTYMVNIKYHPLDDIDNLREVLDDMGSNLLMALNTIDVPITDNVQGDIYRPVRGTDLEYKIEDGVLQFFSSYAVDITTIAGIGNYMNELEINQI